MSQDAPPQIPASPAMFRANPEHTGVYNAAGLPKFHNVKWKFHTAGLVISSPAIDATTAYVGSTDGNLYAVDLSFRRAEMEISQPRRALHRPPPSPWRRLFLQL